MASIRLIHAAAQRLAHPSLLASDAVAAGFAVPRRARLLTLDDRAYFRLRNGALVDDAGVSVDTATAFRLAETEAVLRAEAAAAGRSRLRARSRIAAWTAREFWIGMSSPRSPAMRRRRLSADRAARPSSRVWKRTRPPHFCAEVGRVGLTPWPRCASIEKIGGGQAHADAVRRNCHPIPALDGGLRQHGAGRHAPPHEIGSANPPRLQRRKGSDRRGRSGLAGPQLVEDVPADHVHLLQPLRPARADVVGVVMRRPADVGEIGLALEHLLATRFASSQESGSAMRSDLPSQAKVNWQARWRWRFW